MAQPTLSVEIAKLERELGASLFHRSSQRVHLTDAGARFVPHARRVENEFNMAEAAVRDLLQRHGRGRIDAALTLVREDADRFASQILCEEGYALAVPDDHPAAALGTVAAEALAGDAMIVRRHCEALSDTSRHFTERAVRPVFALRSTNDDQVLAMVRAGLGVTVMPQTYVLDGVARPRLAGFDLRRRIGILYAAHAEPLQHARSPTVGALRQVFARGAVSGL